MWQTESLLSCGPAQKHWTTRVFRETNRGFFEFTLSTLDLNNRRATGNFRVIIRNDADRNDTRVIFASGSFTMPVHIH